MSSLLTPYVASVWSVDRKKDPNAQEVKGETSSEACAPPIFKDLLSLAKRVNQLEDEVAQITAERDRTKAQLDIMRQHDEIGREEIMRKQVSLLTSRLLFVTCPRPAVL
jgi:molecular chaperone GrpE (heat shock protein)